MLLETIHGNCQSDMRFQVFFHDSFLPWNELLVSLPKHSLNCLDYL